MVDTSTWALSVWRLASHGQTYSTRPHMDVAYGAKGHMDTALLEPLPLP